mmetsp:Transcript_64864/g.204860  ORF Transcript_64864/g.204860 Transcript_64864/m.204860 type:complete len:427 (-) Transcript_64864:666-1946(-)
MPHMITVDNEGNVWIVDVGLHQVIKYSPSGTRLLAVGIAMKPGGGERQLCKPTSVAVAIDGSFYVADGYCNDRVVKYTASGQYVREYRRSGTPMSVPHKVLLDECLGVLYVADREGSSVVVIDVMSGEEVRAWDLSEYGKPFSLAKTPGGDILALIWDNTRPGVQPQILQLLPRAVTEVPLMGFARGSVLSDVPSTVGHAWKPEGLTAPHDIAVLPGPAGQGIHIYVAETRPRADPTSSHVRKFLLLAKGTVRRPEAARPAHGHHGHNPSAGECGRTSLSGRPTARAATRQLEAVGGYLVPQEEAGGGGRAAGHSSPGLLGASPSKRRLTCSVEAPLVMSCAGIALIPICVATPPRASCRRGGGVVRVPALRKAMAMRGISTDAGPWRAGKSAQAPPQTRTPAVFSAAGDSYTLSDSGVFYEDGIV